MVRFIMSASEHHPRSGTARHHEAEHRRFLAKQQAIGSRHAVHLSPDPIVAYIAAGSWVVDCECGAGNAVDLDGACARCFGCGAVHENVVMPPARERERIEAVLLERPKPFNRNWRRPETVDTLRAENILHGIGGAR